ncbi:hypothetical protein KKF32_00935 [Patescibacteria group bacterium]|nr:hypothetical protein [Patescibacteria group bacterium]
MLKRTLFACILAVIISSAILIGLLLVDESHTMVDSWWFVMSYLPLITLFWGITSVLWSVISQKSSPFVLAFWGTGAAFFAMSIQLIAWGHRTEHFYYYSEAFYSVLPSLNLTIGNLLVMGAITLLVGLILILRTNNRKQFPDWKSWLSSCLLVAASSVMICMAGWQYIGFYSFMNMPIMLFLAALASILLGIGWLRTNISNWMTDASLIGRMMPTFIRERLKGWGQTMKTSMAT